jgi:cytochrome c oxidase assembly factor CtaG
VIVSPTAALTAIVAAVLFARGFRRLRMRRPARAGLGRAVLFGLALASGLTALSAPLDEAAEESLAAHMLQHVLLADVAPALALLALRGPLLFFVVPAFVLRAVARSPRARAVVSIFLRPPVAFGLWAGTLAFWHLPAVYGAALASPALHVLEHETFLVAGLVAWNQIVDPARRGSLSSVGRLLFVLGMFVAGQMLATTLVLAPDPVYAPYADGGERLGMSARADQDAAGIVMMLEQLIALGLAAAFLVRRHLDEERAQSVGREAPAHPFLA